MELSPIHWLVVLAIVVILFGGKRIPEVMRGMGEGIRSFKEGMRGDGSGGASQANQAQAAPSAPVATVSTTDKK